MKNCEFCLLLCLFGVTTASAHAVRYSLHVVDDESGRALQGVPCETIFTTHTGNWNDMSRGRLEKGLTNVDGDYVFSGESDIDHVTYSLRTEGGAYYPVIRRRLEFSGVSGALAKRWEPYDSVVTVRLQRVERPIPLWVKRVDVSKTQCQAPAFDGTNAVWRYDLVMGDWLPPHGNGKVADMTMETRYKYDGKAKGGLFDFDCCEYAHSVLFTGKGNGIVSQPSAAASGMRLRTAPADGYEASVVRHHGRRSVLHGVNVTPELYSDEDPKRCYAFRIRSRYDEKGNLVEAYYGKIYGDFRFRGAWQTGESSLFLYYLNPTPLDRNLEWDMRNNLCPNPNALGQPEP